MCFVILKTSVLLDTQILYIGKNENEHVIAFLDNLCNGSNAMNAKETILTLLANDADAEPDPCL